MRALTFVVAMALACGPKQAAQTEPPPAPVPSAAAPAPAAPSPTSAANKSPALVEAKECGGCQEGLSCMKVGGLLNCVKVIDLQKFVFTTDHEASKVGILDGQLNVSMGCTKMKCTTERPCCNRCGEGTMLFGTPSGAIIPTRAMKEFRCAAGNNCEVLENCPLKQGRYDAIGTLQTKSEGRWLLDVIALEPAAP